MQGYNYNDIYVSLQLNGSLSYVYSLRPAASLNHCNYKREPAIENCKFSCMVAWSGLGACTDHMHAEVGMELRTGYEARVPEAVAMMYDLRLLSPPPCLDFLLCQRLQFCITQVIAMVVLQTKL